MGDHEPGGEVVIFEILSDFGELGLDTKVSDADRARIEDVIKEIGQPFDQAKFAAMLGTTQDIVHRNAEAAGKTMDNEIAGIVTEARTYFLVGALEAAISALYDAYGYATQMGNDDLADRIWDLRYKIITIAPNPE